MGDVTPRGGGQLDTLAMVDQGWTCLLWWTRGILVDLGAVQRGAGELHAVVEVEHCGEKELQELDDWS